MQYFKSMAFIFAAVTIGVSAAPTNETLKAQQFAINNKIELESDSALCSCGGKFNHDHRLQSVNLLTLPECFLFHDECVPGRCDCLGKFGCWRYDDGPYICQCGPDGPYSC